MSPAFHLSTPLIAAAVILDLIFGDPRWLPHPVRMIGWLVARGERALRTGAPKLDLAVGCAIAPGVVSLAIVGVWLLVALGEALGAVAGALIAVTIASTTLALRGLDDAAAQVEASLALDSEAAARRALPALVGRDPESLDRAGIVRATVESVAENCSDGFVAPLLFLFVGGPAAAIAYKAVNTMDSMIGYRDERYLHFGRCAARMDDAANFIPSRLTALCLVIAAALRLGRGRPALEICRRDARKHPSPNAGYPESAVAGALGVQLGGGASYGREFETRPLLGEPEHQIATRHIAAARTLMRTAALLAFAGLALMQFFLCGFG